MFGVIFDMDGVMVDSFRPHLKATRIFAQKHGFELSEETIRVKYFGRRNQDWMPDLFQASLSRQEIDQLAQEKEAVYREIYAPDIQPVDGLLDFLKLLKSHHIPTAVGTSAPRENLDFVLEATNTRALFDALLDDSMVNNGKPNPEIYLKAAKALNLPPTQCIVIEDSHSGIEAGKRAGARVIGITTTHCAGELPPADLIIGNFFELDYQKLLDLFHNSIF
ncbi:MAG: HAD family hydrolase [Candidatus Cyclobacteriaceae bacterium M3_2C_046]